jgi:hypothetical protein
VRLISSGGQRTLSLAENGSIFTVEAGVTLILDNGIALQERDQNTVPLVIVNGRGTLVMNNGTRITNNTHVRF